MGETFDSDDAWLAVDKEFAATIAATPEHKRAETRAKLDLTVRLARVLVEQEEIERRFCRMRHTHPTPPTPEQAAVVASKAAVVASNLLVFLSLGGTSALGAETGWGSELRDIMQEYLRRMHTKPKRRKRVSKKKTRGRR